MTDQTEPKKRPKILLVEDEVSIIELVTLMLERKGYEVFSVIEGSEVIDRIRKVLPDVVILDIMIPKLNGFEVCGQIKADEKLKDIPVLILSSLVQKAEIEKGIRAGVDLYMTKPFQNKDLMDNIEKLIRKD